MSGFPSPPVWITFWFYVHLSLSCNSNITLFLPVSITFSPLTPFIKFDSLSVYTHSQTHSRTLQGGERERVKERERRRSGRERTKLAKICILNDWNDFLFWVSCSQPSFSCFLSSSWMIFFLSQLSFSTLPPQFFLLQDFNLWHPYSLHPLSSSSSSSSWCHCNKQEGSETKNSSSERERKEERKSERK